MAEDARETQPGRLLGRHAFAQLAGGARLLEAPQHLAQHGDLPRIDRKLDGSAHEDADHLAEQRGVADAGFGLDQRVGEAIEHDRQRLRRLEALHDL